MAMVTDSSLPSADPGPEGRDGGDGAFALVGNVAGDSRQHGHARRLAVHERKALCYTGSVNERLSW